MIGKPKLKGSVSIILDSKLDPTRNLLCGPSKVLKMIRMKISSTGFTTGLFVGTVLLILLDSRALFFYFLLVCLAPNVTYVFGFVFVFS